MIQNTESFPISVNFRSKKPAGEQIYSQLRAYIQQKQLPAGKQLPPVRELAANLKVNFNTVARVYRMLDRDGLISTQQGRGTYVLEQATRPIENLSISNEEIFLQRLRAFLHLQEEQTGLPAKRLWEWIKLAGRAIQAPRPKTRGKARKKTRREPERQSTQEIRLHFIQNRPKKINRLARSAGDAERSERRKMFHVKH